MVNYPANPNKRGVEMERRVEDNTVSLRREGRERKGVTLAKGPTNKGELDDK